jgi:hypothetical protein
MFDLHDTGRTTATAGADPSASGKPLIVATVIATVFLVALTGCDNPTADSGAPATEPASTSITDGSGNRYLVGYDQVTANDQDPYVIKENAAGEQIWKVYHDRTPVDGRGILVVLDGEDRPMSLSRPTEEAMTPTVFRHTTSRKERLGVRPSGATAPAAVRRRRSSLASTPRRGASSAPPTSSRDFPAATPTPS